MNSLVKTAFTACLSSLLTVGVVKIFDDQQKVVFQQAPTETHAKTVGYLNAPPVSLDFSATAEKVTSAVVHIKASAKINAQQQFQQFPFGDFFGRELKPQPREGSGSGVIISKDGYILTNNHVVEGADELEVTLSDKRSYKAKVIGTDPTTDLALIQVKGESLPTLPFGNSDEVKVGQWVLAVGNPFNLESTVTAGIVSAKGRNINILREYAAIESFIQTDAAVNPGNSGGALVNLNGDLIGINTAIATPNGVFAGYSFAVPANIARKIVEDLINYGQVQRGFLGVTIRNLDGKLARELDLDITEGVLLDSLTENGSAKAAGLKSKDVIIKVDDKTIKSVPELQETIGRHRPGDKVKVVVNRKGEEKTFEILLKNKDGKVAAVEAPKNDLLKTLGADFEALSEKDKKKLGIEGGIIVKKLHNGKLRSQTDIKEGFIITKIDKKPVKSVEELTKQLENTKGGILLEGIYPDYPGNYYYGIGM